MIIDWGGNPLYSSGQLGEVFGSIGGGGSAPAAPILNDAGGRITGGTFSRKRWHEIQTAWNAQRAAEERAAALVSKRQKKLAEDAAKAAEAALWLAESYEQIRLAELQSALDAAASAGKTREILKAQRMVLAIAEGIVREYEEEEDEILLLLH